MYILWPFGMYILWPFGMYILWPFGMYILWPFGNLVAIWFIFPSFGTYFVSRKIWQPWYRVQIYGLVP
jgi:hypothetical protein